MGSCITLFRVIKMKEMQTTYDPKQFEDRIYADWQENGCFRAEIDEGKVPFSLMMPPPT